jgi:hypothetical protein
MLEHLVTARSEVTKTLGTSVSLGLTRKQPLIILTQPSPKLSSVAQQPVLRRPDPTQFIFRAATQRWMPCYGHCNHKTRMTSTPNPQHQTHDARTGNPRPSEAEAQAQSNGRSHPSSQTRDRTPCCATTSVRQANFELLSRARCGVAAHTLRCTTTPRAVGVLLRHHARSKKAVRGLAGRTLCTANASGLAL